MGEAAQRRKGGELGAAQRRRGGAAARDPSAGSRGAAAKPAQAKGHAAAQLRPPLPGLGRTRERQEQRSPEPPRPGQPPAHIRTPTHTTHVPHTAHPHIHTHPHPRAHTHARAHTHTTHTHTHTHTRAQTGAHLDVEALGVDAALHIQVHQVQCLVVGGLRAGARKVCVCGDMSVCGVRVCLFAQACMRVGEPRQAERQPHRRAAAAAAASGSRQAGVEAGTGRAPARRTTGGRPPLWKPAVHQRYAGGTSTVQKQYSVHQQRGAADTSRHAAWQRCAGCPQPTATPNATAHIPHARCTHTRSAHAHAAHIHTQHTHTHTTPPHPARHDGQQLGADVDGQLVGDEGVGPAGRRRTGGGGTGGGAGGG